MLVLCMSCARCWVYVAAFRRTEVRGSCCRAIWVQRCWWACLGGNRSNDQPYFTAIGRYSAT